MPRRYTTKRTVIIRRPKIKWSPHMEAYTDELLLPTTGLASVPITISKNSTDGHIPTVPVLQVTRINVQAQVGSGNLAGLDWFAYLIFVPENMDTSLTDTGKWLNYVYDHPEYLMARKVIESSNAVTNTSVALRMTTRLKRNLNSGDQVILLLVARAIGDVSQQRQLPIYAEYTYYTKVN